MNAERIEQFVDSSEELKAFTPEKVLKQAGTIISKAKVARELVTFLSKIKTMVRMLKAYCSKQYTVVPKKTIALVCLALGYVFMPLDVIPDSIPGVGYVDDAIVVEQVLKAVNEDVRNFENWEKQKTTTI